MPRSEGRPWAGRNHGRRRRLRLAAGAPRWLWIPWLASGAAGAVAVRGAGRQRAPAVLAAAGAAAITAFFRDPERSPVAGVVLAPADGVVTEVAPRADGRVRVATYMGLTNVHVNRAPLDGVVLRQEHTAGGHRPAFTKDSPRNERLRWTFGAAEGEVELVQIAGVLARRIVPYVRVGDTVAQGQRLGLIRFGSRVDVVLPAGIEPAVAPGDRVRAGQSRLDRA